MLTLREFEFDLKIFLYLFSTIKCGHVRIIASCSILNLTRPCMGFNIILKLGDYEISLYVPLSLIHI